ncbi:MAG: AbiH family protein [Faecalibacillus sp.]
MLIVGNGFDLAHNLKTRYSDVLEVFKRKSFMVCI